LDFFVNNDDDYLTQVKEVFFKLKEEGLFFFFLIDFVSNETCTTYKVGWNK
jgi:hypothetical protein